MHLSETYGDRAFSVVRGASITGKRWPIVGKRLHDEYPYIEAEVSSVVQLVRILPIHLRRLPYMTYALGGRRGSPKRRQ